MTVSPANASALILACLFGSFCNHAIERPFVAPLVRVRESACRNQDISALPLVELSEPNSSSAEFVLLLTGDGGWRRIDRHLARQFTRRSIPVVGFLSNRYFAQARTPERTACDVIKVTERYLSLWKKRRVILVGYSRGADALPIVVARWPSALRERIAAVALLGPAEAAQLSKPPWWRLSGSPVRSYALLPEFKRMGSVPVLCVSGSREKESLCRSIPEGSASKIETSGGHHFGGGYDGIAGAILRLAGLRARDSTGRAGDLPLTGSDQ